VRSLSPSEEESFRELLLAVPDALLVVDRSGRIEFANPQAEAMFGYGDRELTALPIANLIPERYRAGHGDQISGFFDKGIARPMGMGLEVSAQRKDGSTFSAEISLSPCRGHERPLALAAIRDLTIRKQTEEALNRKQKIEALGTLASGIAHDLNNSMVPVLALTERLAASFEPGTLERESLDLIVDGAVRARALVLQILAFSRGDGPALTPIDLARTTGDALRLIRAGIGLTVDFQVRIPAAPVSILGDATQIHQVLVNLCTNAADAIGAGKGTITIAVTPEPMRAQAAADPANDVPSAGYAVLSVADTGSGIDPATQSRIFDPFFTTKEIGKGTGLGLAIVNKIVVAHGGRIAVDSAVGKGTRFDLFFPRRQVS
jgi:PAS domain S-box-containing protein